MAWERIESAKPGRRGNPKSPAISCSKDGQRNILLPRAMVGDAKAANLYVDRDARKIGVEITAFGDRAIQHGERSSETARARISVPKAFNPLLPGYYAEVTVTPDPETGFLTFDLPPLDPDAERESEAVIEDEPKPEPEPQRGPEPTRVPDFTGFTDEDSDFAPDPVEQKMA